MAKSAARPREERILTYLLMESRTTVVTDAEKRVEESQFHAEVMNILQSSEEGQYFVSCRFRAEGAASKAELPFRISATYGCLFQLTGNDNERAVSYAKKVAGTVLWGRFIDLVGLYGTQMNRVMPPIPVLPKSVSADRDLLVASLAS